MYPRPTQIPVVIAAPIKWLIRIDEIELCSKSINFVGYQRANPNKKKIELKTSESNNDVVKFNEVK